MRCVGMEINGSEKQKDSKKKFFNERLLQKYISSKIRCKDIGVKSQIAKKNYGLLSA